LSQLHALIDSLYHYSLSLSLSLSLFNTSTTNNNNNNIHSGNVNTYGGCNSVNMPGP
jgi:hypothetical protein